MHRSCMLTLGLLCAGQLATAGTADTIYRGGPILTMEDANPVAEALAVRGDRILAVGKAEDVLKTRGETTRIVDLAGQALLPGFIDAHSHIAQYEQTWGTPNLCPPPVGDVKCIADLVDRLQAYAKSADLPAGAVILGSGYDDSLLADKRHPTRHDLDRVSTNHPVLAIHASSHLIAANSCALQLIRYTRDTKDPAGGVIQREADGEPNGVCEELAAMPFLTLMKPNPPDKQLANLAEIEALYARYGITTAQDGISMLQNIALLREAAKAERLHLDILSYPRWDQFNDVLSGERKLNIEYHPPLPGCCGLGEEHAAHADPHIEDASKVQVGLYQHHFKIAGIKITADGSPQGKTAFLTKPYVRVPAGQPADYRGYPTVTQDELDRWFDAAYRYNVQLNVHCNGDGAADLMIAAVRKAVAKHGRKDLRPVMIHAQMIRHDQVDAMAGLGIIPSFFTAHTFYWGDWHIDETVGPERAAGMSPAGYAARKGMRFTNHSDAPVVPPDPLMVLWTAVNRVSRSGRVVGPDERVSASDGLKAMTIHAAYQYFEERDKGSLAAGKRADLVILDRNPLAVDPMTLKDLKVVQTIKDGVVVHPPKN